MSGWRIVIVMHCIVFLRRFNSREENTDLCSVFADSTGGIDRDYIAGQILFFFSCLNATDVPRSAHQQATRRQTGANFRQFGQTQRSSREFHFLGEHFTRLWYLILRPMNERAVHIQHIGGYIFRHSQCLVIVRCLPFDSLNHK